MVLRWHRSMICVRYPSHSPPTLWLCPWGASVLEADPATYLFVLPRSTACIVVSGTATHVQLPRQLVGDRDGDPGSFLILLRWRRGFARSSSLKTGGDFDIGDTDWRDEGTRTREGGVTLA